MQLLLDNFVLDKKTERDNDETKLVQSSCKSQLEKKWMTKLLKMIKPKLGERRMRKIERGERPVKNDGRAKWIKNWAVHCRIESTM